MKTQLETIAAARGKLRIRPLLLILVCFWSLTVFLIVDLFLNASELDSLRPRAELYRAMRYAAHEMVGEPYLEDDEFGAVARQDVGRPRASRVATPVAARGAPSSEVRALLLSVGSRPPEEIAELLQRVQDRPDPALASALLEARSQIPNDLLAEYAMAAASTVASLCAAEENATPGRHPREVLTGLSGALTLAALEAQSRRVACAPDSLGSSDWRSVRVTLERIGWVAPGYERASPFVHALDPARTSLKLFLATAAEAGPGSDTEVEALHLASLVGDEETAEICLRFLRRRPSGKPALTREAYLVEEHAFQTVMRRGSARHKAALEGWLSRALAQARGPHAHRYMDQLRRLHREAGSTPAIRDLVTLHRGSGR